MKRSWKEFILFSIMPLLIAGCARVTPYQQADSKGYGVKTYKMGDNKYKVVVRASRVTDKGTAESYFWRRAQELCGCPGTAHGELPFADHIEGCLRLSHTIRSEGHAGKETTTRRGKVFTTDFETTKEYDEEDTEVSGEVECWKESK